jgi:predicted secreted Zn-dependent protease
MYGAELLQLVQRIKTAVQTQTPRNIGGQCVSQKVKVKVKVQCTLEQAKKAQRGSRGITLLFL